MYGNVDTTLAQAVIQPQTPVTAGHFGTWTIVVTIGRWGIDSGGQIKLARRMVSDWGVPQFEHPKAAGYATVAIQSAGSAKIQPSWQPRGHVRPFTPAVVLDVYDGSLDPGDTAIITLGETSQGSPGLRAQTYIESAFEWLLLVDPTNSCDPRPAARLTVPVVADVTADLVCLIPSELVVGEPAAIFVRGADQWHNPTPPPAELSYEWVGSGAVEIDDGRLRPRESGRGRLVVKSKTFTCFSNPAIILANPPTERRYWGDLHAQTGRTVGVGTDTEYFTFGRDAARLDFMSHQGNDFQISDEDWELFNRTTARFNRDGEFVVFPGYEWSASSPTGGDHNVFYRREGYPILRSSHWLVPQIAESDLSPAHPADHFYKKIKEVVPLEDVIVAQHVGGRYANMAAYFDPDLITLVEVVSVWGVFEWLLRDAIERGYIVGVMGNSDGHHGRPGAEGPGLSEFGVRSGLTCVVADELSRSGIFEALKARRCYATTGERLLLDFTVDGRPLGSVISRPPGPLRVAAAVVGTGPLEEVALYQGLTCLHRVQPAEFANLEESHRLRVSWQGSRERGRQRRVVWDGSVHFSGDRLVEATPFAMDTVVDRIVEWAPDKVVFNSRTTGDRDGLDLTFENPPRGVLEFRSPVAQIEVDLGELTDERPRLEYELGGVDMRLVVERYPETVSTTALQMALEIGLEIDTGPTAERPVPLWIRATQVDGHMAWASPVWVV